MRPPGTKKKRGGYLAFKLLAILELLITQVGGQHSDRPRAINFVFQSQTRKKLKRQEFMDILILSVATVLSIKVSPCDAQSDSSLTARHLLTDDLTSKAHGEGPCHHGIEWPHQTAREWWVGHLRMLDTTTTSGLRFLELQSLAHSRQPHTDSRSIPKCPATTPHT